MHIGIGLWPFTSGSGATPILDASFEDFDPADARLRWAPVAQVTPTTLTTGSGYYQSPVLGDDEDAIVVLPATIRNNNSDIEIRGGRHIRLIGGHTRGRIMFKDVTGSVYIEGLETDLSSAPNKDALVAYGKTGFAPDITIQRCRNRGAQGTNAGLHADVYQPSGPVGHVRIDTCSFNTNYQGFFLRPEFAIESVTISRTNGAFNALGTPDGNTYLYWFRNEAGGGGDAPSNLYPVKLTQVYGEANTAVPGVAAAYPSSGASIEGEPSAGAYAGVVDDDGNVTWPPGSQIIGGIRLGAPPGGDFVEAADAGTVYTAETDWQVTA